MTSPQPVSSSFATKWIRRFVAITLSLLAVVTALAVAVVALARANAANDNIFNQCQVWRDIGSGPVSSTTTTLGISLVADGRAQYGRLNCAGQYGQLPPTDPRVEAVMRAHLAGN